MSERYTVTINEMPSDERPRERLLKFGPSALSTAELLAIHFRTGTRERSAVGLAELLLSTFGGMKAVANASVTELQKVKGIGEVKAIEIAASVELGRRLAALSSEDRPTISGPTDVEHLLMPELRDATREHFKGLLLDSRNKLIKIVTISVGTLDTSPAHPREVFTEAIRSNARSLIIAHNHPSGDPSPSGEDVVVTKRMAEAGKLLGIELLDHIILGDNRSVSMKERGYV